MKTRNLLSAAAALSLTLGLSGGAAAQDNMATSTPLPQATASTRAEMTDGEIRKVDKDSKKITIKHSEIKNLDMPGMTMVFQVKDPAMLDKVQVGDKVKFKAENVGGRIVVTDLEISK